MPILPSITFESKKNFGTIFDKKQTPFKEIYEYLSEKKIEYNTCTGSYWCDDLELSYSEVETFLLINETIAPTKDAKENVKLVFSLINKRFEAKDKLFVRIRKNLFGRYIVTATMVTVICAATINGILQPIVAIILRKLGF